MHFVGSKMMTGLGAGVVLTSQKGDKLEYVLQIHFAASNNVAEYEALVHDIRLAKEISIRRILCYGNSDLVVQQCTGSWDAKDENMASYRFLVQQLSGFFEGCEFQHVPRAENEAADALSKLGSTRKEIPTGVSLENIYKPSIKPSPESESIFIPADLKMAELEAQKVAKRQKLEKRSAAPGAADQQPGAADQEPGAVVISSGTEVVMQEAANTSSEPTAAEAEQPEQVAVAVMVVVVAPSWAEPIRDFLVHGTLPQDEVEARKVQRRSGAYTIINSELVHRSATGVLQRCVEEDKGLELLRDIHQGECGHHASAVAIVAKASRHGFYWPTAKAAAEELVKHCEGCQRFKAKSHLPASALKTIPITWPFAVWGLDMVGPFKTARGGMTHLLVAVDKFTKWIEARPIKKLDGPTAVKFVMDITVRYGVPNSIITDNG